MEEDIRIIKNHYVFTTNHVLDDQNKQFKRAVENLINKNKEQEKVIELMAQDIAKSDFDEDICRQMKKDEFWCGASDDECKNCVIEYYKKKARENK